MFWLRINENLLEEPMGLKAITILDSNVCMGKICLCRLLCNAVT